MSRFASMTMLAVCIASAIHAPGPIPVPHMCAKETGELIANHFKSGSPDAGELFAKLAGWGFTEEEIKEVRSTAEAIWQAKDHPRLTPEEAGVMLAFTYPDKENAPENALKELQKMGYSQTEMAMIKSYEASARLSAKPEFRKEKVVHHLDLAHELVTKYPQNSEAMVEIRKGLLVKFYTTAELAEFDEYAVRYYEQHGDPVYEMQDKPTFTAQDSVQVIEQPCPKSKRQVVVSVMRKLGFGRKKN